MTQVSQYQNVSILDFIGAKDDGGDVLTTGAIRRAKLQSNHHHQQTNIKHSAALDSQVTFLSNHESQWMGAERSNPVCWLQSVNFATKPL